MYAVEKTKTQRNFAEAPRDKAGEEGRKGLAMFELPSRTTGHMERQAEDLQASVSAAVNVPKC